MIKRLTGTGVSKQLPANPTRVYNVVVRNNGSSPITINPGETRTMRTDSIVYDCSSWGYYYAASDIQYDYVGYFASSYNKTEETKTVLAQPSST